ncbi:MAG: beta-ketoacyl-[acyl-carrier-protein] synthase family protein [Candidatus Omnitrophota bacterium]|nr:beta-ketoacyl-[acyl-carrier-protein] synthase family protein [Candidatus Omnitrophota bacterium]
MNKSDKGKPVNRRVVVTGLGVVSSIGIGWEEFWKNLIAGKSGISRIVSFDTSVFGKYFGGEIKNFNPAMYLSPARMNKIGRTSQFAIAAAKMALSDAAMTSLNRIACRAGVCVGTTMGEPQTLEKINSVRFLRGLKFVNPYLMNIYPANVISLNLSQELGFKNVSVVFANACSAGNYSIGYAFDCIKAGNIDIALAGGVDSITRLNFTGFNRLMSTAEEKCRPFDKNRQGILVGEGAGMLILESIESARKRGARIYAEILGYGLSCDSLHMTDPSEQGIVSCVNNALENAGVKPEQIDYISAHGTGTRLNDMMEARAVNRVFTHCPNRPPISSIKSMLGHAMGAASAIEAIACCLAMEKGVIPPTINYSTPDPDCPVDCVPNKSRPTKLRCVLNNSFAFGGNNACVVFKKI